MGDGDRAGREKGCFLQMLRRKCKLGVLRQSAVIQDWKIGPPHHLYEPSCLCWSLANSSLHIYQFHRVGPSSYTPLCIMWLSFDRWLLHSCYLQITVGIWNNWQFLHTEMLRSILFIMAKPYKQTKCPAILDELSCADILNNGLKHT